MARSMIAGLTHCQLQVIEPDAAKHDIANVMFHTEAGPALKQADIVVLAVKPQIMSLAIQGITPYIHSDALIVSIAAGVTIQQLQTQLTVVNTCMPIVRAMPNTPALIQQGMTGLYANAFCTDQHKQQANVLMQAIGQHLWVDQETLLDAVTAVSGSGPAYFFLFMEAMIQAGQTLGLSVEQATQLVLQTGLGATQLAAQSDIELATLRQQVTSKGGTTAQALQSFDDSDLRAIVHHAVQAAFDRAKTLGS